MVSADGGKSWAKAALQSPVLSKALTRFRIPWRWNGGPALLQSRATDEKGQGRQGQQCKCHANVEHHREHDYHL